MRLRLLQPQATLVDVHRTQADFLVRGELEQLVSLGTPEAEGVTLEVWRET